MESRYMPSEGVIRSPLASTSNFFPHTFCKLMSQVCSRAEVAFMTTAIMLVTNIGIRTKAEP